MPEWPGWAYALAVAAVVYAIFLAVLVASGRGRLAREAATALPNLIRLFHGLLRDPGVPWRAKAALGAGIAYLAMPFDLVPDFIPVAGHLDDAIVAALVLGYVGRTSGREVILRHWHGDPRVLRRLLRMGDVTAAERVLFLCVRNSARSQMAEGLLRAMAGDRYEVHSAGVSAGSLRPEAVEAMREIGIDISSQRSKSADEYAGQPFDVVVTTCDEAREVCPLFPGAKRMLHWSIPDPVVASGEARLQAFRAARDELRERIRRELLGAAPAQDQPAAR